MSTARFAGRRGTTTTITPWTATERIRGFQHDASRVAGAIRDAALVVVAIAWQCGIRPHRRRGRP